MKVLEKIWAYITFKKMDAEDGSFLKSMHIINKISIVLFLLGLVYFVFKYAF